MPFLALAAQHTAARRTASYMTSNVVVRGGVALIRPHPYASSLGLAARRDARRQLGDSCRGTTTQNYWNFARHQQKACEFFTKGSLSYAEYKQQCVSLRLFAFAGVTASCVLALIVDPPKSSYWATWGPTYWLSHLKSIFRSSAPPMFLASKSQHAGSEVERICNDLTYYSLGVTRAANKASEAAPSSGSGCRTVGTKEQNKEQSSSAARAKVLFVLGGPGAGKGTQCANIVESNPKWAHISAGDCLRAERQDKSSKDGELINTYIKEGKIVPVEITIKLLQKAMTASSAEGKTHFLIDGFPRNLDNVTGWERVVGASADVLGVLYFEATEQAMEERLLGRGATSGRVDDNIASIKKRFATYVQETKPIIEKYERESMVYAIDAMPPADEVWCHTQIKLRTIELVGIYGP